MFHAPGRVNLIGEHVDYAGGLVLPVPIDRFVSVRGGEADTIRLVSTGARGIVELAADGSGSADGWGRLVAAVAVELAQLGRPPVGLVGIVDSDVPQAAGLGSSAALEVAVARGLCAVAGFEVEPVQLAQACRRAEERALGVPCGIMDQAAAVLGRRRHGLLLDCGTLARQLVPLPDGLAVLVLDSGLPRRLEGSEYARVRETILGGHPHLAAENERVRRVAQALREDDRETLGAELAAGHESLRELGVSTPELDRLVGLALEEGAVAARLTGAGFGGSVVALVDATRADEVGAAVVARYGRGGYLVS